MYLADFFGNRLLICQDAKLDCLSAVALRARPCPPVIPSQTDYRRHDATVLLLDVYHGAAMAGVPRGSVKALRIIDFDVRDTPGSGGLRQEEGPSGGHSCPVTALGGSWHVKRILGTVPVQADGSAAFRIPAERRVFFQPLDERGRAIQSMRSWVEAMPGEHLTCIGCHESPQETPPVAKPMALARLPVDPTPWYGPPRAFGFCPRSAAGPRSPLRAVPQRRGQEGARFPRRRHQLVQPGLREPAALRATDRAPRVPRRHGAASRGAAADRLVDSYWPGMKTSGSTLKASIASLPGST